MKSKIVPSLMTTGPVLPVAKTAVKTKESKSASPAHAAKNTSKSKNSKNSSAVPVPVEKPTLKAQTAENTSLNSASEQKAKENKSSSVIVQVNEETAQLLNTIQESIRDEIYRSVTDILSSGDTKKEDSSISDIKKITKKVNDLEESIGDISDKLNALNFKIDELVKAINKKDE